MKLLHLLLAAVLAATAFGQQAVRVDNATKVLSEPPTFFEANASAIAAAAAGAFADDALEINYISGLQAALDLKIDEADIATAANLAAGTAGKVIDADLAFDEFVVGRSRTLKIQRLRSALSGVSALPAGTGVATLLQSGDSTAGSRTPVGLFPAFYDEFGFGGIWIQPADSGTAFLGWSSPGGNAGVSGEWTKSLNGEILRISSSLPEVRFFVPTISTRTRTDNTPIDSVDFVYARKPGGATIKLQTKRAKATDSPEGWVDLAGHTSISTDNATVDSQVISFSLPAREAGAQFRAVWVSGGTADIIGAKLKDSTVNGFVGASIGKGGVDQTDLNTIAPATLSTILGVIAPDLITWSNKDEANPATAAADLLATLTKWDAAYPTDWVCFTHYPDNVLSSEAAVRAHADAIIATAKAAGKEAWDTTNEVPSLAAALALGIIGDVLPNPPVHFNQKGAELVGSVFWRATGLLTMDAQGRFARNPRLNSVDAGSVAIDGVDQRTRNRQIMTSARAQLPYIRLPATTTSSIRNGTGITGVGTSSVTALALVRVPASQADMTVLRLRSGTGGGNQAQAVDVVIKTDRLLFSRRNDANTTSDEWSSTSEEDFWALAGQIVLVGIRRDASPSTGETALSFIVGERTYPLGLATGSDTSLSTLLGQTFIIGNTGGSIGTNNVDVYGAALYHSALTNAQIAEIARTFEFPSGSIALVPCDDGFGEPRGSNLGGSAAWANVRTITPGSGGGTGVDNGTKTITLGGNLTTSGAFNTTFTITGTTGVTFPTSGTLATTSGNVATATALATARTINGTSFNGSADITVTAAAGTLTGSTLASGVTASSLTSTGTVTAGTWNTTVRTPVVTVATLPGSPVAGQWSAVSDALTPTAGGTVTGGGALFRPVVYDGTNWTTLY